MKKFFLLLCGFTCLSLSAGLLLPEKWDVNFFKLDEKTFLKGLNITNPPEKLHIKAIDENGRKFDEFVINKAGEFKELYLGRELKKSPLPKNG